MRYTVKAAARATGITESRLRTWERRYGVPRPARSESGRRQYDDDDIAVIRRMRSLVESGLAASDAAEAARLSTGADALVEALPPQAADPPFVLAMVRAANAYDEATFVQVLRQAQEEFGWGRALESVIFLALKRIGYAWMEASASVAAEHFASQIVRREIGAAMSSLPLPDEQGPLLLLACPASEEHELALLSLALLLRLAGQRLIYLGPDMPTVDLLSVVESTRPEAICLAATTDAGRASLVRASRSILAARGPRLFLGGPAVSPDLALAAGVHLPPSLVEAVKLIRRSLGD